MPRDVSPLKNDDWDSAAQALIFAETTVTVSYESGHYGQDGFKN
jgi:hypothetical protein